MRREFSVEFFERDNSTLTRLAGISNLRLGGIFAGKIRNFSRGEVEVTVLGRAENDNVSRVATRRNTIDRDFHLSTDDGKIVGAERVIRDLNVQGGASADVEKRIPAAQRNRKILSVKLEIEIISSIT